VKGFKAYINNFGFIKEDIYNELVFLFKQRHLSKNELFTAEGAYANHIGFLEKGIVRSFIRSEDGKEYTKQFFIAPTIIGAYASLLTQQANKIIQQGLTDCIIWTAEYSKIERLYEQHHEMERIGRKIAEYHYLQKEQSIMEMALLDAKERYSIFKNRFPTLESTIPQYYIASYLGISATQLSRIRKNIQTD